MGVSVIYRGVAMGIGLALLPVAAFAVGVYGEGGDGEQHRTHTYTNGAVVSGTLESQSGKPVYYNGRVIRGSGCAAYSTGRYSSDTTSYDYVTRGGTMTASLYSCGFAGVKSRICENLNNLPDPCGADSEKY